MFNKMEYVYLGSRIETKQQTKCNQLKHLLVETNDVLSLFMQQTDARGWSCFNIYIYIYDSCSTKCQYVVCGGLIVKMRAFI